VAPNCRRERPIVVLIASSSARCKSLPPVSLRRTRSFPLFIADLPRMAAFTIAGRRRLQRRR
jgi:hypothetical protein